MKNLCLECGSVLQGRADKKFCNNHCRNTFHNRENCKNMEVVRNINKALKKNRLILMTLANGNKSSYVSRDELLKKGFDFDYITRKSSLSDGNQINIVYDFCYYSMGNNSFKISNIKSYNQLVS